MLNSLWKARCPGARYAAGYIALTMFANMAPAQALKWVPQGPGPTTDGQVEQISDREVAGAINAVAPHPKNADVLYIGAVNGGIWKTVNGRVKSPTWERQTDDQKSLSFGAIEFDPTDATHETLVAGHGRFSSLLSLGGARAGALRTTNGGATWQPLGPALQGLNISGVAPRGSTIVVVANAADDSGKVGLWRSTDTGTTWTRISGATKSGLPDGPSSALVGDPDNNARLYTDGGASAASSGLYRSNDSGATWTRVSDAAMNSRFALASNVRIAVRPGGILYVAVVSSSTGQLSGVFRSGDSGGTWTAMSLPSNAEGGIHPGEQGGTHLSLAADPNDPNIVYIGGDRQDGDFLEDPAATTPNSIGARDYSGRLFRGDASRPPAQQWVHLTHSKNLGAKGGGTASGSAPHADSRNMRMDADGNLIEVDDGGIYRRTSPRTNAGDWLSLNGNLQVTEFHSVAWDANAKVVVGGAQDTGTPQQRSQSGSKWRSVTNGDGGVVAVDDTSSPKLSTRYSSYFNLGGFRRRVYNASNALQSEEFLQLQVLGGGTVRPHFYTPIRVNAVEKTRLVIGARNGVFESLDQGDTVNPLIPAIAANGTGPNPLAYGAKGNPDALYVGTGNLVYVRTEADNPLAPATPLNAGTVVGIALDPDAFKSAFVATTGSVLRTDDAGATWTNVTGNLGKLAPGNLRSVAFSTIDKSNVLFLGADTGVFMTSGPSFNDWSRLGADLPTVPVYHLEYSRADKLVLAGTMGRGAWTLSLANGLKPSPVVAAAGPKAAAVAAADEEKGKNMGTIQLRPGVMIDPAARLIYLMNPAGGIEAVDIAKGGVVWTTREAAKPLAMVSGRLIAQAEPGADRSRLKIVALDPATGKPIVSDSQPLPAGVTPSVQATAQADFAVLAAPAASGDAVLTWQFEERAKRGLPPGTKNTLPAKVATPVPAAVPGTHQGMFRLNLTTGALTAHDGPLPASVSTNSVAAAVPGAERLPGVTGTQMLSVDGRYIMSGKRTGDETAWEKYTLTIYDRSTRQALGSFKSRLAALPFAVVESRAIFETTPFKRQTDKGEIQEPARIHAVNLTTGDSWSRPVRETVYRGPSPP